MEATKEVQPAAQSGIAEIFRKPEARLTPQERKEKILYLLKTKDVKARAYHILKNENDAKALLHKVTQILDMYAVQSCTLMSVIDSAIVIQALGLEIYPELGEAWITGYNGEGNVKTAKPDISYKGWKKIAARQGFSVDAEGVFTEVVDIVNDWEDVFSFNYRRQLKTGDVKWIKENLEGVVVKIKNDKTGEAEYRYVDRTTLDKLMASSPSVKRGKHSAYIDWYYEMMVQAKAMKYVLKREVQFDEVAEALSILYKSDADAAKALKPSAAETIENKTKVCTNFGREESKEEVVADVEVEVKNETHEQ